MRTPEGIETIPTTHADVVALLQSRALADVEQSIAARCGIAIDFDGGTEAESSTLAEISVSGLTASQLDQYLASNCPSLIEFGVRFLSDDDATCDEQEYPAGEEPDSEDDEDEETVGFCNGFGITVAIYHNFLANRTPAELRAYLKNRRIPKHTSFAKELTRVFSESPSK